MSATRAAWTAAFRAETAGRKAQHYAQVLLDLEKAFETVPHRQLWEAAARRGYPLSILRLSLAAYKLPRAVGCDGVYSRSITASRGITAGSGTATSELRALTIDLYDILASECPSIAQSIYVDDVNLEATADPKHPRKTHRDWGISRKQALRQGVIREVRAARLLTTEIAKATSLVAEFFQNDLQMRLSAAKSKVVANSGALARSVAAATNGIKLKPACATKEKTGKMLGVATNGGRTRTTAEYHKRVRKLESKRRRYSVIAKSGICTASVVRATAMPSVAYGLEVNGIADTELAALRRRVATLGRNLASGGSNDADWYGRDGSNGRLDPAFLAHSLPIAAHATAWWEGWASHRELHAAYSEAVTCLSNLQPGANLWQHVKGPVATSIASAARIGWTFTEAAVVRNDLGQRWDLRIDSPADIKKDIERAVISWRAANVLEHEHAFRHIVHPSYEAPCPADVLPIFERQFKRAASMAHVHHFPESITALRSRNNGCVKRSAPRSWNPEALPHLLSAMAGRQWPQARVAANKAANWASDDTCRLCNAASGTLQHRSHCPAISQQARCVKPPDSLCATEAEYNEAQIRSWTTRGIGAVRIFTPAQKQSGTIQWLKHLAPDVLPESVAWYTDASLVDADTPAAARFGTAAVAINRTNGHLEAAAYGIPPASVSCISSAEIWAISMVTVNFPAWEKIVTDCQVAQRLAEAGPEVCRSARAKAAQVWATIMRSLDADDGYDPSWLTWMPAHTARTAVGREKKSDGQVVSIIDWIGNHAADLIAKSAAETVRVPASTRAKLKRHAEAALHWRATLGARTYTSQNFKQEVTGEDGSTSVKTIRDSDGKPNPPQSSSDRACPAADTLAEWRKQEEWAPHTGDDLQSFERAIMGAPFAAQGPVSMSQFIGPQEWQHR